MKADVVSEASFQRNVINVARMQGWRVQHSRKAQVREGRFVTPISGDVGFPDLVLVRDVVLFVELKTNIGRLSKEQLVWGAALTEAGARYLLWRPRDWTTLIVPVLTNRRAP